ncbi:MAG: DUF4342 domain-containing protein [Lachnospiraceae bacterium]|nr:DUF4342 domain-containing protein [Lachnospiraceae bacterium]
MELFEKVEKLRQKADVSYEEAKEALEKANGDLLDAMILLEKEGKTQAPKSESYSTDYESSKKYPAVIDECCKKDKKCDKESINDWWITKKIKELWKKGNENFLVIEKDEETIVNLPVWVFIVIMLLAWHISLVVILITLICGCHYRFEGKGNLEKANNVAQTIENATASVKEEFTKDKQE